MSAHQAWEAHFLTCNPEAASPYVSFLAGYTAGKEAAVVAQCEETKRLTAKCDELLAALIQVTNWHGEDRFDALIAKAEAK